MRRSARLSRVLDTSELRVDSTHDSVSVNETNSQELSFTPEQLKLIQEELSGAVVTLQEWQAVDRAGDQLRVVRTAMEELKLPVYDRAKKEYHSTHVLFPDIYVQETGLLVYLDHTVPGMVLQLETNEVDGRVQSKKKRSLVRTALYQEAPHHTPYDAHELPPLIQVCCTQLGYDISEDGQEPPFRWFYSIRTLKVHLRQIAQLLTESRVAMYWLEKSEPTMLNASSDDDHGHMNDAFYQSSESSQAVTIGGDSKDEVNELDLAFREDVESVDIGKKRKRPTASARKQKQRQS